MLSGHVMPGIKVLNNKIREVMVIDSSLDKTEGLAFEKSALFPSADAFL